MGIIGFSGEIYLPEIQISNDFLLKLFILSFSCIPRTEFMIKTVNTIFHFHVVYQNPPNLLQKTVIRVKFFFLYNCSYPTDDQFLEYSTPIYDYKYLYIIMVYVR